MEQCSFCNEGVEPNVAFRHRTCGHVSHAKCLSALGPKRDLFNCARVSCGGTVIERPAAATAIVATGALDEEPRPPELRDYILQPGERSADGGLSTLGWMAGKLGWGSREEPLERTQDPWTLLQHQVPVRTIIGRNRVGLQHFCKAGVTAADFLQCGYTLRDLCEFRDISGAKGKNRALQALAIGLRANANLFRDYPDAFPVEGVRKLTGMGNNAICEYFGLSFPHALSPLQCQLDAGWRAADVINLGLTIENLADFGLQTSAQYEVLTDGLSTASRAEVDRVLGVTKRHRDDWAKADAQILEQQRLQQEALVAHVVVPAAVATIAQDADVIRAPTAMVVAPAPAPVIHHVPPHAPMRAAGLASYEQKAAQRAKLHGFKG